MATFDVENSEEFYYVPEGQLVVGDYAVRVQYINGNGNTKITLIVKGGVSYYLKEFDLYSPS